MAAPRRRTRLAAAAAAAVTVALGAAPAAADQPDRVIGYDHVVHEGKLWVDRGQELACTRCHKVRGDGALIGRPGHAACLGACHGPAPRRGRPPPPDRPEVCTACHASGQLRDRRPAVPFPPYRIDPDFGLSMSHAAHAAVPCTSCHPRPGAAAATGPSHARCGPCHAASATVPMTACATCHPAASGARTRPEMQRGVLAVGDTFSHARHAGRTPAAAAACPACHAGVDATAGRELPAPTTAACATAGCHDGAAAFAATVACTRCHRRPPAAPFEVARPAARFSHDAHAAHTDMTACSACHAIDRRGEPVSTGHAACTACHAADYASATPVTCGACHVATEPWRALRVDALPRATSDFGVELPHAPHAAVACSTCHRLSIATRELRPPRGHAACTGDGCHARDTGPAPHLPSCDGCHTAGLQRARDRERTGSAWSVRTRFRHQPHRTAADGAPLACAACHTAVATTAAGVPATPTKAECAPCHDGHTAFKMTGHGCARCHGR